jgi:hypothetical protein
VQAWQSCSDRAEPRIIVKARHLGVFYEATAMSANIDTIAMKLGKDANQFLLKFSMADFCQRAPAVS